MNILLVSHYFPPEIGPGQSRAWEYATRLAKRGHCVTVLTCFPNYPYGRVPPEYRWRVLAREKLGEVLVVRTFVLPLANAGFVRRLLNQLSFAISAFVALFVLDKIDVVDVISPPLFLALSARLISWAKRSKFILEVLDLWPESAIDLGQLSSPLLISLAKQLAAFLYRHSDAITVSAPYQGLAIIGYGIPKSQIHFVPNSVDVDFFASGDSCYLANLVPDLRNKSVALYLGNIGWAQGLETVLLAAQQLQKIPNIAVVLMGEGGAKKHITTMARDLELRNVTFLESVPRDCVPHVLRSADLCIASLHTGPVFRGVLPTKILEYMAAGRPVVASVAGDAADAIAAATAGITCEPGDPGALADALQAVLACPAQAAKMGQNGLRFVAANYSRDIMVARLESLMLRLSNTTSSQPLADNDHVLHC